MLGMQSDTWRRLFALVIGAGVLMFNNKLGIGMGDGDRTALVALIVGYFTQSVARSIFQLKADTQ